FRMASCAFCGETILFGGVTEGDLRFCNTICQSKGQVLSAAARVPDTAAANLARQIHMSPCPRCQGPGPVDVHTSYWGWWALVFTRWGSHQHGSCRRCALKSQSGNLALSVVLGWWGFPWGFLFTPVQVVRTAFAIVVPPNPGEPSAKLVQVARVMIASQPAGQGKQGSAAGTWEAAS